MPNDSVELVIFSDDWGKHPSSCQHLIQHRPRHHQILWVNTLGTRMPRLCVADFKKILTRLTQWLPPPGSLSRKNPSTAEATQTSTSKTSDASSESQKPVRVISPRMYPGFRTHWQRKLNARWISRQVNAALGPRKTGIRRIVIATIPIVADLVGKLDVDRWVYYCVDDFSVWPGLDSQVMQEMEGNLVQHMDEVIAVSQTLKQRLNANHLLTHGIDLPHWRQPADATRNNPSWAEDRSEPIFLFWGLIDQRLDLSWCEALSKRGRLVLVGPTQSPDSALSQFATLAGPASYAELPQLAQAADVLVMPYADLPVTRAMQPLKFKEYLATGKPVVGRCLPGVVNWADAADLVQTAEACVDAAVGRAAEGLTESQQVARQRLEQETWAHKATLWMPWLEAEK